MTTNVLEFAETVDLLNRREILGSCMLPNGIPVRGYTGLAAMYHFVDDLWPWGRLWLRFKLWLCRPLVGPVFGLPVFSDDVRDGYLSVFRMYAGIRAAMVRRRNAGCH